MLSSTMSTLIGGTDPSSSDEDGPLAPLTVVVPFVGVAFLALRGLDVLWWSRAAGVGGVLVNLLLMAGASEIGGVGRGGGAWMPLGRSDVVESERCRADARWGSW